MKNKKIDKCCEDTGGLAIGGGTVLGVGVGFFFLEISPLYFVACIMIGLGIGLFVASLMAKTK